MILMALQSDIFEGDVLAAEPPNSEDVDVSTIAPHETTASEAGQGLLDQWLQAAKRDVERYPEAAKPLVDFARALISAGHLDEAQTLLERAVAIEPGRYSAVQLLAEISVRLNNMVRARRLFDSMNETWPNDSSVLLGLAAVALASDDQINARALCLQATHMDPDSLDARLRAGAILTRLQSIPEAIAQLKAATRLDPHSAAAFYALGVAYAIQRDRPRAQRSLEACLTLAPESGEAVRVLSRLLLSSPSADGVLELLRTRVDQAPNDYVAHDLLAQGYLRSGDIVAARRVLMRALASVSSRSGGATRVFARIANNLGVCYQRSGQIDSAIKFYRRAVETQPDGGSIPFQNLGAALVQVWDLESAARLLDDALQRYPHDPKLDALRGLLLYYSEAFDAAIEHLSHAAARSGAIQLSFETLAASYQATKQYSRAVAVLTSAAAKWPVNHTLANALGYTYLMWGKVDEARSLLADRYDGEETDVALAATRGLLQLRQGDVELGRAGYEAAAALASKVGDLELRSRALRKMHVELARTYWALEKREEAISEVRRAQLIRVRAPGYQAELEEIASLVGASD